MINYILYQIENNLKNRPKFEITDTFATLEHIFPQNQNNEYNFEENQKTTIMNSLPNLTLLEFSKNKNLGNTNLTKKIVNQITSQNLIQIKSIF